MRNLILTYTEFDEILAEAIEDEDVALLAGLWREPIVVLPPNTNGGN